MADNSVLTAEDVKELQPLYAAVIAALKEVYDPEIPVNIYDLGLIYELTINKEHEVSILMTKISIDDVGFFGKVDDFAMSEDEYVASQSIHSLSFGYVINREYHSRGDMGWWAMVSNEKEPTTWDEEYKKFIESLPDDAELTMLDCHI